LPSFTSHFCIRSFNILTNDTQKYAGSKA
jgi:hypothetical protein